MSLTVILGGDSSASPPVAGNDITALTDFGVNQQVQFTLPLRGQRGTCTFQMNVFGTVATPPAISGPFTAQPLPGDTFVFGTNEGETYTFVTTPVFIWDVQIGATLADTVANLVLAINGSLNPLSKANLFTGSSTGDVLTITPVAGPFTVTCAQWEQSGNTPVYPVNVGQEIKIYDDGNIRWTGTVDSVVTKSMMGKPGAPMTVPGTFYTVNGVSEEARLDKRMFTGSFPIGTLPGDIIRSGPIADIITAEGITLGTIQDGVALTADLTYVNGRVSDILTTLCSYSQGAVLGSIGTAFIWGIFDGVLYFQQANTVAAPFNMDDDGMLLTPSQPNNTFDRSTYRNVQHIQIATSNLAPSQQSFTGDGTTDSFTLQFPIGVILSITITAPTAQQASLTGAFLGIPSDGDTFSWGSAPGQTYTFRNVPAATWDVQIGTDAPSSALNLANAINGTGGNWLSAAVSFTASVSGDGSIITFTTAIPGSFVPTITVSCSVFTWSNAGSIVTGDFTGQPTDGDFVSFTLTAPPGVGPQYTFRNSPTDPLDVQIGATLGNTIANLVAAINGTVDPSTAAVGLAVAASVGSVVNFTLRGPGVIVTVSSSAWTPGAESGPGVDGGSVSQTFSEQDASNSGDPQWTYVAGQNTVTQTANQTPPAAGSIITITYQPIGFGNITVSNPKEITNRKAIEGGSGIYENAVNRPDLLTVAAGLQAAYALLNAYDSIAQTIAFYTYEFGLLPGQIVQIVSTRLNVNGPYLIQSIQGLFEKTNEPGNHFRYLINAVLEPLQKTWIDFFIKMAPQTLGNPNGSSAQGGTAAPAVSSSAGWIINHGVDDDTVGTDVSGKHAPFTGDGTPTEGLVTCVTRPPNGPCELDVEYSTDGGSTWTSMFGGSQKITIPQAGTTEDTGDVYPFNGFNNVLTIPAGATSRLNVLTGGNGAKGILVVVKGGVGGTPATPSMSGQLNGSPLMFTGDAII